MELVSDHMNDYLSDSVIFCHFYVIFSNQNRLSDRQNLKSFRLEDFLRKFIRQLYEQLSRSCFRLTGDTQRIDQKLKIRISTWIIRSLIWEDDILEILTLVSVIFSQKCYISPLIPYVVTILIYVDYYYFHIFDWHI